MVRKIKNRKTAEERRAQAEELQGSIAEQVEQLRDSEQWVRFLEFAQSFHRYSLANLLLILSQCPTATRVAGFRQWQVKGRQVRKGERPIRIFGYAQKKITAEQTADEGEDQAETTEDGQKVITYYPVLSVFDIGQTEAIDPGATQQWHLHISVGRANTAGPAEAGLARSPQALMSLIGAADPTDGLRASDPGSGRCQDSPARHPVRPRETSGLATN